MPEDKSKLSPAAKLRLSELSFASSEETVAALVRLRGVLTENQRREIEGLGAEIRSEGGDVVTMNIGLDRLPGLTGLDFVRYVDISRPLDPEPGSD